MSLRLQGPLIAVLSFIAGCPIAPTGFEAQELLWPDGAPLAHGTRRSDEPRLFFYPPEPSKRTRTAVVIASGGSYGHHGGLFVEGTPTAKWLAKQGITAVIVRYRVGGLGGYDHRAFLADGARAIQIVRARADVLGIDADHVGMIGYSAGGHLAASLAMRCPGSGESGESGVVTPIDVPDDTLASISCRPDFAVPVYPVVTLAQPYAHARSRKNLLGEREPTDALVRELSLEHQATASAAPMFIVHSNLDSTVPVQNAQLLYDALARKGADVELRRYDDGEHGVGLARRSGRMPHMSTWTSEMLTWMGSLGYLEPYESAATYPR